ncbi:MAG TPA: DUF1295 domain-containing protein [Steroidobacteraceae bacterium]|nr:DUF1295 domain-containing protein [Steroidobacteraceae bacterium]
MSNVVATWLWGLWPISLLAVVAWGVCTMKRNVGLIDIFWSLFLLIAGISFTLTSIELSATAWLVLLLLTAWALRLAVHLAMRNWSAPEDHRYQEIRARNQPGFEWKSIYLVFLLQAVLAWIVSASLVAAITSQNLNQMLVYSGAILALFGFLFESTADLQLTRFRANSANRGQVLQTGLWKYTRHPNYFGECCFWWGMFLMGASLSTLWTLISPLLMTVLLMRVSGVALLEKSISDRRPAYRDYVARTNAFFPGPPKELP